MAGPLGTIGNAFDGFIGGIVRERAKGARNLGKKLKKGDVIGAYLDYAQGGQGLSPEEHRAALQCDPMGTQCRRR